MAQQYQDMNQLIDDMIDGYKGSTQEQLSVTDFNGNLLEGLEGDAPNYWRRVLDYMKEERTRQGHTPLEESDFPSDVLSVFKFIQDRCDLDVNHIMNDLKDQFLAHGIDLTADSGMGQNSKDYFWNESLSRALAIFLNYFDSDFNGRTVFGHLSADDIKEADAGNSFVQAPWVKPYINVDLDSYSAVRGADKIESVLKNDSEMQFTRNKNSKWIRLLMPKYSRKVEVEDLDRNFWVTSQILGAVCDYLFDDDAPFEDLFKTIISELIQLWENVLYLWATLAVISQKETITAIHTEIIPVANDDWQSYIKFDNFDRPTTGYTTRNGLEQLGSKVWYIIDQYSNSNVCIVPQVRSENYKHNYYGEEFYPGFIFYDRNKGKVSYLPFLSTDGTKQISINAKAGATEQYKNIAGAIKEDQITYSYIFPVSLCDAYDTEPYYILLRTIPQITISYDETEGIVIDTFEIDVYDVSRMIYGQGTRPARIEYFKKELDSTQSGYEIWSSKRAEDNSDNPSYSAHITHWIDTNTYPSDQTDTPITDIVINQGYYAGEFPSYCYPLLAPTYNINLVSVNLVPFVSNRADIIQIYDTAQGDSAARDTISINAANTYLNNLTDNISLQHKTYLINEERADAEDSYQTDKTILEIYASQHDTSTDSERNFQLYIGNHMSNMWDWELNYDNPSFSYWKLVDGNIVYLDNSDQQTHRNDSWKRKFKRYAESFGRAAVLYNPVTRDTTSYDDYKSYCVVPTGWLNIFDSTTVGHYVGTSINYTKTFLTGQLKIMDESNWYVEYTEVRLGVWPLSWVHPYISNYKYNGYDTIVNKVMVHVFGPNGFYGCKVYERYEDVPANRVAETANLANWKLSYINQANYEHFAAQKPGLIVLKDNQYDFEKYPNTGKQISETMGHHFI